MQKAFEQVKELLANKEISNYRISQETGIAQSTLSDYVKGKTNINRMPVENAIKLHNFYLKEMEKMNAPVKKLSIYNDDNGNPFIYRAWNENEIKVVSENDEIKPSLIIEDGLLVGIELNGLDLTIPEFDPVKVDNSLIFLRKEDPNAISRWDAWQYVLTSIKLITVSHLGELREDYREIVKLIETELNKSQNEPFKNFVMENLNEKIDYYRRTKIWDLPLKSEKDV